MDSNQAAKIQSSVRVYALIAVLLVSIAITAIALIPLYGQLRDNEKQGLIFARDTGVLLVNQYLGSIRDVSKQISSRTKARMLTEEYLQNKISQQEMQTFLNTILGAALSSSSQLVSITRVSESGELLTKVGKDLAIPTPPPNTLKAELGTHGPYNVTGHFYMLITSPVTDKKNTVLAYDYIIFDVTNITTSIHGQLQHRLGEILVAYFVGNDFKILSPFDNEWSYWLNQDGSIIRESFKAALQEGNSGLKEGVISGVDLIMAYAPLENTNWAISVVIEKRVLFERVRSLIYFILMGTALIVILFIWGLGIFLQPMSGKLIMHEIELKDEIEKANNTLKNKNIELNELVTIDPLTGVLNRRGFYEKIRDEMSRSLRYDQKVGLIYIDMDKFKEINDKYGHNQGDDLLKHLCTMLADCVRASDYIARLGGDEFIIVLPQIKTSTDIAHFIEKLREISRQNPFYTSDGSYFLEFSAGHAIYPDDSQTLDGLLRVADKRMYAEKDAHKKT